MASPLYPETINPLDSLELRTTQVTSPVKVPAQEYTDNEIPQAPANISVD